jgi:hypothetical protein
MCIYYVLTVEKLGRSEREERENKETAGER